MSRSGPIVYEFIFRDGGKGSTPTSSGTIPVNPGTQPGSGSPELPQSAPKPPTGAATNAVTAADVEQIVNRAAERQANNRPQPPAKSGPAETVDRTTVPVQSRDGQREAGQAQPTTLPTSKPEPRPPAGEATLDTIREATNRAGGRDAERQAPGPPASQGSDQRGQQGERIEIPVRQPQQAPTSAQGPELPSQPPGQVTPQGVNQFVQQVQTTPSAPGQRPLPEHPDLPSLRSDIPTPPNPPTPPPIKPGEVMFRSITGLASQVGSAVGAPGIGSLAAILGAASGAAAPTAGVAGAIGLAGLYAKARIDAIESTADYSPEVMQARSLGEVKEIQRRVELARKYGEQDALLESQLENARRAGRQIGDELIRNPLDLINLLDTSPWGMVAGDITQIKYLLSGIWEYFRDAKSENPMARFMEEFKQFDPPAEFTGGVSVHENHEYEPVIGL